jgi:diguanylate cyclase (GGDEF)-like protein
LPASPVQRTAPSYAEQSADPGTEPVVTGEFTLITRRMTIRTGAETGLIVVFSQADRLVHVLGAWGTASVSAEMPVALRTGVGFVGRVLESARTAVAPVDPDEDQSLGIPASGARITHAAGAGIRPPGGPPGALCVGFSSPPADSALTLWRLESYARLAALCLHERGTLDGLLATARLDGLTGCLNYAAIRAELDREIRRSERHGRPMSCCFIDLDHFKGVNDRHGHLYGNRVLAQVATALREGVRVGDTIGRYGGDEFLAILPDADEEAARLLGERLRSKIFTTRPSGISERLDTSIGIAQWQPGSTADDLLGAADAALLRAKEGGGGIVAGAGGVAAGAGRDAAWGHAAVRRPR